MRVVDPYNIQAVWPEPTPFVPERPEWQSRGNCVGVDVELFYPTRGDNGTLNAAKAVCRGCEVASECLEWALAHHENWGVWGNTSERERRRIRKRRRSA